MFVATAVLACALAIALLPSARGKLMGDEQQVGNISALGFPGRLVRLLGVAELCGALGLIAGLFWWPLGVAAAVCLIGYFLGALGYLRKAPKLPLRPVLSAIAFLAASVGVLVLRLVS
jgi:uncharacterized membrane protein YphA (DoxX/SURF4 family)